VPDSIEALEEQLNDFDRETRRQAVEAIAAKLEAGELDARGPTGRVNVHLHTFFSFNSRGWSPSRIVWEGKKAGLDVVGSVDFDVLDAMAEMFEAGDRLAVRTNVALETRVFAHEFADKEFSSPGEPGVLYFMGTGFTRLPEPGSEAAAVLDRMRQGARARNEALLDRLRPVLEPMQVDYEREVLPLGPSGNVTERHMLAVLDEKAREMFPDPGERADYWAERTGIAEDELLELFEDTAAFRGAIRKALMKKGGPGYKQPDETTFPPIRDVVQMVRACQAIPCSTWLDGTRDGEENADALCDWFLDLGVPAMNIIPDRNWNLADPEEKALKTRKLADIVAAARKRHLILSVGTEMNKSGQRLVDDFDAPELEPYAADFCDGAYILYGHTILDRAGGKGYLSDWAENVFGGDRADANAFYLEVGRRAAPPADARAALAALPEDCRTQDVLRTLG
jgi:hypothetical protein